MTHCDRCGREQDWLPGYLEAGRIRTRCAGCSRPDDAETREIVALVAEEVFGRTRWQARQAVRVRRRRHARETD